MGIRLAKYNPSAFGGRIVSDSLTFVLHWNCIVKNIGAEGTVDSASGEALKALLSLPRSSIFLGHSAVIG